MLLPGEREGGGKGEGGRERGREREGGGREEERVKCTALNNYCILNRDIALTLDKSNFEAGKFLPTYTIICRP